MPRAGATPYAEHFTLGIASLMGQTSTMLWWCLFVGVLVASKGFIGQTLYYDSAAIMWLASAATIPLSDFLFILAGTEEQPTYMYVTDALALVMITTGVIMFNMRTASVTPQLKDNT